MADLPPKTLPGDEIPKDLTGSKIGRYLVKRGIGRGGMGEVYVATDTLLERPVALKRVARKQIHDARSRQHLLHEAQRASKVNDPRIAAVHDVLEVNDEIIVVMEFVEGEDLRKRMSSPFDMDEFWDLAQECAKALEAAHRRGLIHRDIKPENIMLSPGGQVKILDLGLAHRTEGESETLSTKAMDDETTSGTPAYMAPEAVLGSEPDERSDIFSLGVVFYELLARRRPFAGKTLGALGNQIINVDPEPICCVRPETSPALSWIVSKMLAKDPTQRFSSAGELLEDLVAAHRGEPVVQRQAAASSKPLRRRALGLAALLVILFLVVLLGPLKGAEHLMIWAGVRGLPTEKHVAVLPMEVKAGGEDLSAFALGLTDLLTTALSRLSDHPNLQVQSRLQEVLEGNVTNPRHAHEILGANLVLETQLEEDHQNLTARMQLVDAASGRTLRKRKIESSILDPLSFVKSMFHEAVDLLEIPSGKEMEELLDLDVEGAGTIRFYLCGLGKLRGANGSAGIEAAIRDLRLACDTDPDNPLTKAGLARALLSKYRATGDSLTLAVAENTASEAIDLGDDRPEGHMTMARILMEMKRWEEAIEEFEKTLTLNPMNDLASYQLGQVHSLSGDKAKGESVYKAAIERRPHYWRPYRWLAVFYYRQGRYAEARRNFELMVQRAPDLYLGYSHLGGLQVLEGDYETAVQTLQKSILLRPTDTALSNLGTAYFNMRQFDRAIHTYNQAFQHRFGNHEIWANLGDAYFWAPGKRNQAEGAYRHAVRLGRNGIEEEPEDFWILANLGHVYPKLGEPDSARMCIEVALDRGPENPNIQYCAALTYWQIGEKERALDLLEEAVAGGYPARWLRDSAVFDDWRSRERFQALIEPIEAKTTHSTSTQSSDGG